MKHIDQSNIKIRKSPKLYIKHDNEHSKFVIVSGYKIK